MRMRARSRLGIGLIGLIAGLTACASSPVDLDPQGLPGLTIVYRFPTGRLYRAAYAAETVHFELLEPVQTPPPSASLPYRARLVRPGLFLVVWEGDPRFHSTFLIDLERREIHASSLRENDLSFFGTAEIEKISRDQ